uniref:Secreted protein n=1 Tax=Anopheles darlingi TaxID=43151 RepID=A0A2M4D763_ANODA
MLMMMMMMMMRMRMMWMMIRHSMSQSACCVLRVSCGHILSLISLSFSVPPSMMLMMTATATACLIVFFVCAQIIR